MHDKFGTFTYMQSIIIIENSPYELIYYADPNEYSTYLPVAENMISSLEFISSSNSAPAQEIQMPTENVTAPTENVTAPTENVTAHLTNPSPQPYPFF